MAPMWILILLLLCGVRTQLSATFNPQSSPQTMITNGQLQNSFYLNLPWWYCSMSNLYIYRQTALQQATNQPTTIAISGVSAPVNVKVGTYYGILNPVVTPSECGSGCNLSMVYNCAQNVHYFNYFDMIQLGITTGNYSTTVSYFVLCNQNYPTNTVEYGLFILIIVCTVIVVIAALFSRAWSLGGRGIEFNFWLVIIWNCLIIVGAVIGYFSSSAIYVILVIVSFVLGTLGVAICVNQLIYMLRSKLLAVLLFRIDWFQFRVMEVVSLLCGAGLSVGWYYSDRNILLNDALAICITVAVIKILKFTSLKIAGFAFLLGILIELVVVIILYATENSSYNNLFINEYNFPIGIQIPTINPVFNMKCSWMPFTSVAYSGMVFSYLRRFDTSRNTKVYLITSTLLYLVASVAWGFVDTASPVSLPYLLISAPCMYGLICLFAFRRRQIRVLWEGKFYDQQFADNKDKQIILEMMERERSSVRTIDPNLIQELKEADGSSRASDMDDVVRSKFIRRNTNS